jgi:hypothetical protein
VVHHRFIDLHHLVDDPLVPVGDGAEVAVAFPVAEAIHHPRTAVGGQVERQHFRAEFAAQRFQQRAQVVSGMVDLVDHDGAAQPARLGMLHHAAGAVADADVCIHHHRHGLHRRQRRQRRAAEIWVAGGIDQVDVDAGVAGAGDRGIDGVAAFLLDRVEVGDRAAALDRACRLYRATGMQQGFEERCFAGAGMARQGHVADLLCAVGHEPVSPVRG